MSRGIKVYDTTLRDGTQGEGVAFSMEDKVRIAQRLDALGIHYIEGGWPGSNPKDLRFFKRVQDAVFKTAKITAFGSTRRPGVRPQEDGNIQALVEAGPPVVSIFGKAWDFHVTTALATTLEEHLAMIGDSVGYLLKEEVADGIADHGQVLFERGPERGGDVEVPRFAENGYHRRARLDQRLDIAVLLRSHARSPGRSEGRDLGGLEDGVLHALKEAQVLGVGARPAAFDIVDAERIEALRDADLVLHGEGHTFSLGAIAEGRIVDLDQAGHGLLSSRCPQGGVKESARKTGSCSASDGVASAG